MARTNGVEELLPYTTKGTEARIQRRMEHGLRVKGTGVGQKVKGKAWERTMKGRLEKRRQAMLGMPKMVQEWKQVCVDARGRCWRWVLMGFLDGAWEGVEEVAEMMLGVGSVAACLEAPVVCMNGYEFLRRVKDISLSGQLAIANAWQERRYRSCEAFLESMLYSPLASSFRCISGDFNEQSRLCIEGDQKHVADFL